MNASLFKNDARRTAGDNTGTRSCWLEHHATSTKDANNGVHDGAASKGNREHVALGVFGSFLDGQRNFLGLSVTETNATVAIANHNKCGERETTTTLDDLGHAVDVNHA